MKKPQGIATTSDIIAKGVARKCDGTHKHREARGVDCTTAEGYTDAFARHVHRLVSRVAAEHVPLEDFCVAARAHAAPAPSSSPAAPAVAVMAQRTRGSSAAPDAGRRLRTCAAAAPLTALARRPSTPARRQIPGQSQSA